MNFAFVLKTQPEAERFVPVSPGPNETPHISPWGEFRFIFTIANNMKDVILYTTKDKHHRVKLQMYLRKVTDTSLPFKNWLKICTIPPWL